MTAARVSRLTVDRSSPDAAAASHPRSRLKTRSGRRFLVAAAVAAVVSVAFTIWIGFRVGGDHSVTVVDDLGEAIAALIAAGSCGYASRREAGRMRVAWGLLAASALSWGVGEVIWSYIEVGQGRAVPFPSAADAGYLVAIPLAVAGVLTFPSAPSRVATRAQAILDGAIVALSLIFISWAFGLASVYQQNNQTLLTQVIGAAYPVGDVIIIAALLLAMRRATPQQRGTMALLLAGLAAAAVADSSFAYLTASGVYTATGNVTDAGWVIGYFCIALAPFWPAHFAERVAKEGPADLWQMSVPWLSLFGAGVVALGLAQRGLGLDQFLTAVGGAVGILLVVSMVLLHRDSLTLLAVRDRAEQQLEQRTNLLNEVILHAPLGVVRVGPDYRVLEANPRMGTLLHAPEQIMVGSLVAEFLSPEETVRVLEQFKPLDTGLVDNIEGESPVRRADGSEVWLHWSVTAVRKRSGKLEYYLAMFEDITAKHEAEETAAANLAGLERLNQLKSEFVSMVSHEFRTALVGIQGFSELLMDESTGAEEVRSLATDINNDALRLNRMISEMLDLDRMEAGKVRLNPKPVDANALVSDVVERARASSSAHAIKLDLDQALPIINADPDRLIQVISNLVNNAIKYSPDGGEIKVMTTLDDGYVHVAVIDHGVGIAPENISRVFGRYERFESNKTSKVVGTGLGLAISRQIIELHGGKIWVDSKVGEGSVFQFTVPVPAPIAPDPAVEAAH
ncbi:MAG TPA: ATP-binding protein [Candidatus Dormibacteraeota bacterium]|nr:ATP-binding protein [Candidatus Dormibacteraeota bacterium]